LKFEFFADFLKHLLNHLTKASHELKVTFGKFLFELFILLPQISDILGSLRYFFLYFYEILDLGNKLLGFNSSVFFKLVNDLLFIQKSLDTLDNLPDISYFIFNRFSIIDNIRHEHLVDLKLFINELFILLTIPYPINSLTGLINLFLE
jgi:hypothetical protein